MGIKENVAEIREKIAVSAKKAGRNPADIKLIGVTKGMDAEIIKEALAAGITDLGENRVQEFLAKYEVLKHANLHFIGHLQRNKVKHIMGKAGLIHSVDTFALADEINRCAEKTGKKVDILLEVNIAEEPSKYGTPPSDAPELSKKLSELKNICLRGLMCIAPYVEDAENNRKYFELANKIKLDIQKDGEYHEFHLSCGMSGDYWVAVEEGSSMVRIGTAIFR